MCHCRASPTGCYILETICDTCRRSWPPGEDSPLVYSPAKMTMREGPFVFQEFDVEEMEVFAVEGKQRPFIVFAEA